MKKHEKLIMEENDLKENLKTEVTKVKEKLEKFLSESNNIIKLNEKINKGIKNLEKEEKNIIKTLSYISKMNKNKKQMNNLLQNLMRNIKISFQEEATKINYEEYFFNGIQIPKNIEFKNILYNSFKIVWNFDNLNILNFNKDNIKFRVELRKEKTKEKFEQVYEGNATEFIVQNLTKNTNYEIRICSFYNDLFSNWTEIKKIKTNDLVLIDSAILRESKNEENFWTQYIHGLELNEWNCYIGDPEMVLQVKYFMKNVIIKGLHYAYIEMKKDIFLEAMHLFLGLVIIKFMKQKIHLYSL